MNLYKPNFIELLQQDKTHYWVVMYNPYDNDIQELPICYITRNYSHCPPFDIGNYWTLMTKITKKQFKL